MPSKFASVLPGLKPLPVADQTYQDNVNATKELFTDHTPTALAKAYTKWRQEKEFIELRLKDVNLHLEAVTQLLVDSQEAQADGWGQYGASENTLRLVTGDKIEIRREPYGQVNDKDAFHDWCIANGYERQMQLWPTTMNAIVRERLVNGDPLPDGTEVFAKDKIVFTAMKVEKTAPEIETFRTVTKTEHEDV